MDQQQLTDVEVVAARAKLVHRLAELERRAVETADQSMQRLHDATGDIRAIIQETTTGVSSAVSAVSSSVCETLDVGRQIRDHPWQSLGLAAVAGFLVGIVPHRTQQRAAAASPGSSSDLWSTLRREFVGLGETLIASGAAALKQSMSATETGDEVIQGAERPTLTGRVPRPVVHNGCHR